MVNVERVTLPSPAQVGMTAYMRAYREARRHGWIVERPEPEAQVEFDLTEEGSIDPRPGHCPCCSEPTTEPLCCFCVAEWRA